MKALRSSALLLSTALALSSGCSSDDSADGEEVTGREFPVDTSQAGVEEFLTTGSYKSAPWVFDEGPRPKTDDISPHDFVRVYFNPTAVESIQAGNGFGSEPHLRGSMVVKEIYDAQDRLLGKAVSMKTGEDRTPKSWLYYCDAPADQCGNDSSEPSPFYSPGNNTSCAFCHGDDIYAPLPAP